MTRDDDERGVDPLAEPTEAEVRAAARLRDALEGDVDDPDADFARALHDAVAPQELSAADLDRLVSAAVAGDLPASVEERVAAEALRQALERGDRDDVVQAIAHAAHPRDLAPSEHARLVATATRTLPERTRSNVLRAAFGAAAAVAAVAAAFILGVQAQAPAPLAAELVPARSTQPLFDEPFQAAATTARIDRIALARAGDFRENRFTRWGVR